MRLSRNELTQIESKIREEIPSLHFYALDLIDDSVARTDRIMRGKEALSGVQNIQKDNESVLDTLQYFTLDADGQVELTDELYMRGMLTVIVKIFMQLYDPSIRSLGITISNQTFTELSLVKYRSNKISVLVDLGKKIAMDMIKMKLTARSITSFDDFL